MKTWSSIFQEWLKNVQVKPSEITGDVGAVLDQTLIKVNGSDGTTTKLNGWGFLEGKMYKVDLQSSIFGKTYQAQIYLYSDGSPTLYIHEREIASAARALHVDATEILGKNWDQKYPKQFDNRVWAGNIAGLLLRPDPLTGDVDEPTAEFDPNSIPESSDDDANVEIIFSAGEWHIPDENSDAEEESSDSEDGDAEEDSVEWKTVGEQTPANTGKKPEEDPSRTGEDPGTGDSEGR
ncbi:MAG TPA: hypothetical protein VKZ53_04380 [Candidatus Angelobacter sp.]|nr:hypothetical protein [Candidatus Angelobacter sp.]